MLNIPKKTLFVEKINEGDSESDDESPLRQSEYVQLKYLQHALNSINAFIMSLVITYMVSHIKLLYMSWYKNIKPFHFKLILVIKKYLCGMYDSFPGVDPSYNDLMLVGMGKYFLYYQHERETTKKILFISQTWRQLILSL